MITNLSWSALILAALGAVAWLCPGGRNDCEATRPTFGARPCCETHRAAFKLRPRTLVELECYSRESSITAARP